MKILDLFIERRFADQRGPYIIAEAGVNHEGDIDIAKRLIDEAKLGGAHAIKFQTYKASSIACKFSPSYWDTTKEQTESQYQLFQKYDKFWKKEFEQLKFYCDGVGIEFISTPFDLESAKFLNELMDVFKISSSDITNKPFIEYICSFGKPIILSTGASYMHEIEEASSWIDYQKIPLALLHCILNYPTINKNANLAMIQDLKRKFPDKVIGYSDHAMPGDMKILEMASLLGAVILEKHFTHDKNLPGNDHYHAMDKDDLIVFTENLEVASTILGKQKKRPLDDEMLSRKNARRSLVAAMKISKGTIIQNKHLTWKRPAHGISPKHIEAVIGRECVEDILEDQPLKWSMLIGDGVQEP